MARASQSQRCAIRSGAELIFSCADFALSLRKGKKHMAERIDGVAACVFDAYGTLFDFSSAARDCREALGERAEALIALWREKQLQTTWLLAAQGRHRDFWTVT